MGFGSYWRSVRLSIVLLAAGAAGSSFTPLPVPSTQHSTSAAGSGGINRAEHVEKPYVLLISFDGMRADYLDRFELPNFRRVLRRGARAQGMTPVFPTLTFPNHYSLVTGLYAEHHGIVGNAFYDPQMNASFSFRDQASATDGRWYRGEPVWVTAETQGMVAACFFWPGSDAEIKGVRPTFWNKYDGSIPNAVRISAVLEWLRLPAERRPHMITLYFGELDAASHNGPLDSPAIAQALDSLDTSLGRLLDGLDTLPFRDRIYLVLTSDHGMNEIAASRVVLLGSVVDTDAVKVGFTGPVASLHVSGGKDRAQQIRDQINARLKNGRAYLRHEMPDRYHYRADPRIGDVVIVMDESWTIATSAALKLRVWQAWGQHGWDPQLQAMRAVFVLSGPGVRQNATVPGVQNVDVYPFMAEVLGLRPAEGIDGRPGYIRKLVEESDRH